MGLGSTRPTSEDAIWRSEVRRKGAAGDMASAHVPDSSILAFLTTFILLFFHRQMEKHFF